MRPEYVYIVLNGYNGWVWDTALSLEGAKHRGLLHIPHSPLEIYWSINGRGNVAAYTKDGEHHLIEIVKCKADFWDVIQTDPGVEA